MSGLSLEMFRWWLRQVVAPFVWRHGWFEGVGAFLPVMMPLVPMSFLSAPDRGVSWVGTAEVLD